MPLTTTSRADGIPTGLPEMGLVPWGTHVCHFFRSRDDLRDALVPYFRAGLEHGDLCIWVTAEPFTSTDARDELSKVVPNLADYEAREQIRIIDFETWYLNAKGINGKSVLKMWMEKEREALQKGFSGLRITGNTMWLERQDWDSFADYEACVHSSFRQRNILALCSYSLNHCSMDDVLDVLHNHASALLRRDDTWELIDSATQLVDAVCSTGPRYGDEEGQPTRWQETDRQAGRRLARLQRVTSALSEVRTMDALEQVLESDICAIVGAAQVLLTLVGGKGREDSHKIVCRISLDRGADDKLFRARTPDACPGLPSAVHTNVSLWLCGADQIIESLPGIPLESKSLAVLPLSLGGVRLGTLLLGFPGEQAFDASQRAFIFDIAAQVALTAERTRLNEESERHKAGLLRASRAKDQFMAMLGHELRNPLAAIRNVAEMLKHVEGDIRIERIQGILERQSLHMSKLLDGLLDVSRIVRGKIEIRKEPLDLAQVLRESLQDIQARMDSHMLVLEAEWGEAELWVMGDKVRLAQVFDNLLSNAIKFTPSPGTIRVRAERQDAHALVSISDSGTGIAADLLPHVFDAFQQGAQELARSAGGLGLGLAVVKGLVSLHAGEISAHSEGSGQGAEFRIRIPLCENRSSNCASEPSRHPVSERILIVEDNTDAADTLGEVLKTAGHQVRTLYDGDGVLSATQQFEPSVVLCDIGLPGRRNGYEVARALRSESLFNGIYLIALTGYGRPKDVDKARRAGFDAHLTKPIDLERLDALLREVHPPSK